jgi:hypothetical protein
MTAIYICGDSLLFTLLTEKKPPPQARGVVESIDWKRKQ